MPPTTTTTTRELVASLNEAMERGDAARILEALEEVREWAGAAVANLATHNELPHTVARVLRFAVDDDLNARDADVATLAAQTLRFLARQSKWVAFELQHSPFLQTTLRNVGRARATWPRHTIAAVRALALLTTPRNRARDLMWRRRRLDPSRPNSL